MIRHIRVENFRCFEQAEINDLGLINVIVGSNASGKTALLEAIFAAASGQPDVLMRLRNWRGLGTQRVTISQPFNAHQVNLPQQMVYNSIVRDLFSTGTGDKVTTISLLSDNQNSRKLRVHRQDTPAIPTLSALYTGSGSGPQSTVTLESVSWEYTNESLGQSTLFKLDPSGVISLDNHNSTLRTPSIPSFVVPSSYPAVSANEPAQQFSQLSIKRQDQLVRSAISDVFPQITDISVELIDNMGVLHCAIVGGNESGKIPLLMVSSGISKLLNILLAIATIEDGIILIDEIENGLYYETLPKVWDAIYKFAHRFNVQVFAVTHSKECLEQLLPSMKGNEESFRLIRLEPEGRTRRIRVFKGQKFEDALEREFEVR